MKFSAIASLVAISVSAVSAFDKIIAHADSFTDNGNDYKHSKFPPSPPYWKGRFSNGPTWLEYVAKNLTHYNVSNNGYGGATTDNADVYSEFNNWTVPGLKQQIETLKTNGTAESLYIIYIGYNDLNSIINPDQYKVINKSYTYQKVAQNVATGVKLLQSKYGAKDFLVLNCAPFYHWPVIQDSDKSKTKTLINNYNSQLETDLKKIGGANFNFLDDNSWFEEQIAHPEKLNLSTSNGACAVGIGNTTACNDPEEHFFFDYYHPEAKVHKALGAWVLEKMHTLYQL
ncbi:hypothetical protein K7432_013578 [Basidiobolus ranarum]|uniref:Phosphatidylcholine-sterol acyltransferase n=1 Tax=Basidiobolus ranarum TaxID=34480 RepID=A0ABR2WJ77_9FUNG